MSITDTPQDKAFLKFLKQMKEGIEENPDAFNMPRFGDFKNEMNNIVDLLISDPMYRMAFGSICLTWVVRDSDFQKTVLQSILTFGELTERFEKMDMISRFIQKLKDLENNG